MGQDVHEGSPSDDAGLQRDGETADFEGEPETAGFQGHQPDGDGRADLHPGVCQPADSKEGTGDGRERRSVGFARDSGHQEGPEEDRRGVVKDAYQLGKGDTDSCFGDALKDSIIEPIGDKHDHHPGGVRGEGGRRCGTGVGLRANPKVPLWNGNPAPFEPEGGEEFREDLLPLSKTSGTSVPLLCVDHLSAVQGRGELQVQEPRAEGADLCGGDAPRGAGSLPPRDHDQGRKQRLHRQGDVCQVQEATPLRAEEDGAEQEPEGAQGQRDRLRRVPEVSRMAAAAEMSGQLHELPPKTARKIKAAVQKAVSFWKQIQLILGEFQEETEVPHLQKIMKDLNSEICQELAWRPGGTKRSREIAEIMGLSHQQLKTIAEIYNPGCFGKIATKYNLTPGRAFDIRLGSDLRNKNTQDEVKRYIRTVKPGLVLLAPPCRMYSQLQNLSKNKRETNARLMKKYLEDRKEAQDMLQFAIEVCQLCLSLGLKFVFEHPYAATSWRQQKMQDLLADERVFGSRADQCQYGLRGDSGELQRKATGFMTNDGNIHQVLQRRCNGEHQHDHIIGGNKSKKSQEYPSELIQCILKSYQATVKENVELLTDEQMLMENYALEQYDLLRAEGPDWQVQRGEDSGVYRRDDSEQGHHSGLHEGDDPNVRAVQELMAVEDEGVEAEPGEVGGEVVAADGPTQDLPLQSRFSLKRLLQRAHEGLGHPSMDKFIRILRYSKAKPEVIEEAKRLSCSVCRRHQQVKPARRSAPLRELEFNDTVGTDVIYLPTPNQKTRPALNVIDWATKFQLVIPLKAKKPSMVREAYRHWLRLFGPPKKIATDMGREFKTDFLQQATEDGTYVDPAAVEAPHQRGITERHGKTFKFMLMKAMDTYNCSSNEEWESLVDVTTMTKNRMLQTNGYSPIQRVLGFTPRLPGGLLSGDDGNRARPTAARLGDLSIERAMKMRKAASLAFVEADASDLLRRAISTGPRPMEEYEIGEMVYFYRMGMDKAKKFSPGYWQGPARIVMMDQPSTLWLAHQGYLVKAAPERIRRASLEENLAVSGWLADIVKVKQDLATEPKRGFMDLAEHPLPPVEENGEDYEPEEDDAPQEREEPVVPLRRYHEKEPIREEDWREHRQKKARLATEGEQQVEMGLRSEEDHRAEEEQLRRRDRGAQLPVDEVERFRSENARFLEEYHRDPNSVPGGDFEEAMHDGKRELEGDPNIPEEQPTKRTRLEYLEIYHLKVENLVKSRQKKEIRLKELSGKNYQCFNKAITKEIKNNIDIGAYKVLDLEESARVKQQEGDKIMDSRFVLTAKPLEPQDIEDARQQGLLLEWDADEPCKAKARHVMKGYSETGAEDIEAATPQVTREATLLVTQLIASHQWKLGFLDFTQAFHSGDKIQRTLYATQPREGIPGLAEGQLLRLEKVCYGLTDGPLAWYRHLRRYLVEDLKYLQSLADPCVFYSLRDCGEGQRRLGGVIAVATDDLLHGGDEVHLQQMEKIRQRYKLGKYQFDQGRFTGKNFTRQADGSVTIDQEHYTKEKLMMIEIEKNRKKQRYSHCSDREISQLRGSVGALSWLAKESRPDLAGKVALLQQAFPRPRVRDLIEANNITQEAQKTAGSGIRIMPIDPKNLRVGVATDASWANASEKDQLEDDARDSWQETDSHWIRHHRAPRNILFHPGANIGPDLHDLLPGRKTVTDDGKVLDDCWTKNGPTTSSWRSTTWTGRTYFAKQPPGQKLDHGEINEAFLKLMNCGSQGGYIMMFYDKRLETEPQQHMVSVTSWKSTRLKRKTVNTLSAECQSLVTGVGQIHWHRFLLLELLGADMSHQEWERKLTSIPFVAVVDSRSLHDCLNKLVCTFTQVEDKRTAIDVAILKDDLYKTGGHLRWVAGPNMIADPLTKRMNSQFLRMVCNQGFWSLTAKGHHQLCTENDVLLVQLA